MRVLVTFLLVSAVACSGPKTETPAPGAAATTPNAQHGQQVIGQYGCTVCHTIPGVDGAGTMGPSLAGIASRPTISSGVVKNTPANLTQFIQNPASLNPQSPMPPMGLPPGDAQDVVAYLQTLK